MNNEVLGGLAISFHKSDNLIQGMNKTSILFKMHGLTYKNRKFESKNKKFELQGLGLGFKARPCPKRNMDLCRRLVTYETTWVSTFDLPHMVHLAILLTSGDSSGYLDEILN